MELVPIIQISLVLFTGLLLLVLLISYIVFKLNKNEQTIQINQEYGTQMNNGYYSEMRQDQTYHPAVSMYDDNSSYYNGYENQQIQQVKAQPVQRRENPSRQSRYTVVYNEGVSEKNVEKSAYYPERSSGLKYRFAPTKNTNAFAQFK